MNRRAIRAVALKDLKVVSKSKAVLIPILIVPLVLLVILPAAAGIALNTVDIPESDLEELGRFIDKMPASMRRSFDHLESTQDKMVVAVLVYLFAPMFLILPLMCANVIAADSFAGEKERKTLEALLYTPTTDGELYMGKVLAPWLAALAVTAVGFLAYAIVVNVVAWPIMGKIFFPNTMWIALVMWLAPAAAALGLAGMVLVSLRVDTFQEAYQTGGMVVLPLLLLIYGQIGGVIYFSVGFVLLIGLVLWVIDALLLWYGARSFRRGELLA